MKITFTVLVLALLFPVTATAQTYADPLTLLDPAESLVLKLYPVVRAVEVDLDHGHGRRLGEEATQAIETSPVWIRAALYDTLTRVGPVMARTLAECILAAAGEDPRYVDEVAFSIAHLPVEDLLFESSTFQTAFDPELILENVRGIYGAEAQVHFARLVEHEEGTDQAWTTVALTLADGEYEVPRDMYYWYVVHPRLADDSAFYVDPRTGNPSTRVDDGVFWRTWIWEEEPSPDYRMATTLKAPEAVTDLAALTADGGLEIPGADAIVEVAGEGGEPLLLHYARGRGMVYATTLPVEEHPGPLLRNLIVAGYGHGAVLSPYIGGPVLLLKDRAPFGDTAVESFLSQEGFDVTVLDATGLAALTNETDLATYKKIIIAGDQPLAFYQALEAQADLIEAWLDNYQGKVLLFLGAMGTNHGADDWSQALMPLGLVRVNQGSALTGAPRGYPTFREVITLPESAPGNYVWDGEVHSSLSGQRFFSTSDMVLDRLGYLVSQTLELNVSEIPAEYRGPDGDCPSCGVVRSAYPQRIIYQHYGNCGELQDTGMAFGRSALIPSAGVGGITEDHVWNEFYVSDRWLPFQVSWSDSETFIAVPGNIQDKDYGGGKDLAIVYRTRPDGKWENVTERYSNTFTFALHVTDADGAPVAGAEVLLASENWYDPSQLNVALLTHTDHQGNATLALGDFQNFYLRVRSAAGSWPGEDSVQWVVCADAATLSSGGTACPATAPWDDQQPMPLGDTADATWQVNLVLEGSLPPRGTVALAQAPTAEVLKTVQTQITYTYDPQAFRALHLETAGASYTDAWEFAAAPGGYLFDEANLERFLAGEDATAMAELTADGTPHVIPVVGSESLYAVVTNGDTWGSALYVDLTMAMEPYAPGEDPGDITPAGSSCTCQVGDSPASLPIPLFFLALLGLVIGRSRARQR